MRHLFSTFSVILIVALFLVVFVNKSYAALLYTEDFGGSSQNLEDHNSDWVNTSSYFITDNDNVGTNSETAGGHEAVYYGPTINSVDIKYKVSYQVTNDSSNVLYFISKTNSSLNTGYGVRFNYSDGADHMWIQDRNSGSFLHTYDNTVSRSTGDWLDLEVDYHTGVFTMKINGTTVDTFTDTTYESNTGKLGLICLDCSIKSLQVSDYAIAIAANPTSSNVSVGTPFNVDVKVNSDSDHAFNAAQATVSVSSNLSVTGIHNATSNACNFQYTKHPKPSDPSFAGAIFGGSSAGCTVYTMTLTPTATGTGTVNFTNASIKSYADNSDILTGTESGSYTIAVGPTPTPTSGVNQLTITSPLLTYLTSYTLAGGKDPAINHVFINTSETGVTFPTSTTWQKSETLSLGNNNFTIYGSDGTNQTATQNIDVNRHTLGDINGDGVVDLTDASLFAIDFGKTSNLTYILSDMNNDGNADLTDLSILAKLE